MTTLALPVSAVTRLADLDPLHLATAGFLARYKGRTLEAYNLDLRCSTTEGRRPTIGTLSTASAATSQA